MKIGNAKTGETITVIGNSVVISQGADVCCIDLHQYSRVQLGHLIDELQAINDKARIEHY
jgi:hypothetical protein